MNPDAPIGVFDSGVGGLSVLRAIHDTLPAERLIYLADSAHAPYGDRPVDFVRDRSLRMVDLLVDRGVKAVVIACNTASVLASEALRSRHAIPIVAMEPAIKPAVSRSRSKVVGVLATRQTLASVSVARLCARYGRDVRIVLQACPGLVERVEAGDLSGPTTRALLDAYVSPLIEAGADVLVLGCTHYPFLEPSIRELVGPGVDILDASRAVAAELKRRIAPHRHASPVGSADTLRFCSTSPASTARPIFNALWGRSVAVEFVCDGQQSTSLPPRRHSPTPKEIHP